jgi:hypothetical protein
LLWNMLGKLYEAAAYIENGGRDEDPQRMELTFVQLERRPLSLLDESQIVY